MATKFTWVPIYKELAQKLLRFKADRKPLVEWIYSSLSDIKSGEKPLIGFLHERNRDRIRDVDPFTVYAIFNRGLSVDKRKEFLSRFKAFLSLDAEIPTDFCGIPVMNAQRSCFYSWEQDNHEVIENYWSLLAKALAGDSFESEFNSVVDRVGIKYSMTMALFWILPDKYLALDSKNRTYLKDADIIIDKCPHYKEYLGILQSVKNGMASGKLPHSSFMELSQHAWEENASNDDSHEMTLQASINRKYWLVGHAFGSNDSQFERFVKDGIWEGRFDDRKSVDRKQLELVRTINIGDVILLKSTAVKQKTIPFLRIKAVGIVSSNINEVEGDEYNTCRCDVKYFPTVDKDFDGSSYGAYRKTVHLADDKVRDVIDYANSVINSKDMPQSKYSEYIKLLRYCRNLVLTGAPGTGKTYMANKIALEMGEREFVQFHPSYDYTDFIEGLRPVRDDNGQLGFERRNGIFKEFCKRAYENLRNSERTIEDIEFSADIKNRLNEFLDDAIENEKTFRTLSGTEFSITSLDKGMLTIYMPGDDRKSNELKLKLAPIVTLLENNVQLNKVQDVRDYFKQQFGTQQNSYYFAICNEVRKFKAQKNVKVAAEKRKDFVFIVDEINRGELSKIFGELFFSIDPGYRGQNNLVNTQYQNLVEADDVFAKGFFIPENVYLIGTMNDIDRSVESMDFALRRRFTWKEIKPTDTEYMLDSLGSALSAEAKKVMHKLNEVITKIDGLGAAYMIGPSYFLKLKDNGGDFEALWDMSLEPLLKEYLRGFRKADECLKQLRQAYFGTDKDSQEGNN